jgi:hypothetical protein
MKIKNCPYMVCKKIIGMTDRHTRLALYCPANGTRRDAANNLAEQEQRVRGTGYGPQFRQEHPEFVDSPIRFEFGDNTARLATPTVVKSRLIGDANGVLLPFNRNRHWSMTLADVAAQDVPWYEKRPAAVWRGVTTGACPGTADEFERHPRTQLVMRWHSCANPSIDVGYSGIVQGKDSMKPFVKGKMPIPAQLKHQFVISVEGNDVATNLKWVLASNSVPVMPPPRYETWLLESQLRPWVHYVPVKADFSNLADVLEWCKKRPRMCHDIAQNGRRYIAPFFETSAETALEKAVLKRVTMPCKGTTRHNRLRRRGRI